MNVSAYNAREKIADKQAVKGSCAKHSKHQQFLLQ